MAKKTVMLKRWIALDWALSHGGVWVSKTAKEWGVSPKMIKRYLEMFEEMEYWVEQVPHPFVRGGEHSWKYVDGQGPMFTANLDQPGLPTPGEQPPGPAQPGGVWRPGPVDL
jgi:hypothetical protein